MTLPALNPLEPASPVAPCGGLPPARAFGTRLEDLDLDFDATDRLVLATTLVAQCTHAEGDTDAGRRQEVAWSMPVSARIARLLRIASLTEGSDVLEVVLPCPEANCGAAIEVALPLDRLLEDEPDPAHSWSDPVGVDMGEGKRVELRRPTGADQRAWREHAFGSASEAMQAVVRSLAAPDGGASSFEEREVALLAGAMEEADPLAAFRLSTVCPACAREVTIPVDLEAEMLRRLAAAQSRVVQEVHDLASRYGWSESQILAIPPRRRARYLRLIESSEPSLP